MEDHTVIAILMRRICAVVLMILVLGKFSDAKNYGYQALPYGYQPVVTPVQNKICSSECTKWKPKLCWDGYLKKKVWKMVCENFVKKCCLGYEGPNCEKECFNCDTVKTFERRFVEIYGKMRDLDEKCSNITHTNTGGNGNEIEKDCTCPAGPKGDQGRPGPIGPPGIPGPQGQQGRQGRPGEDGPMGSPGSDGVDGLPGLAGSPGLPGKRGQKGDPGAPGAAGLPGYGGRDGSKGEPGRDGLPGRKGDPGLPGNAGAGRKGERGPKGNPGEPGIAGLLGGPGTPGRNGFPGRNGQKGERGDQGRDGIPGVPGIVGLPGPKGSDGVPGLPGPHGPRGPIGFPGSPGQDGADGRPGDITKIEESRVIQEMLNTIKNLETRLETTTREVTELRTVCDRFLGCRFNCTVDTFTCACGMCIPKKFQCDGFPQCPDGSDEDETFCVLPTTPGPSGVCSLGEFRCNTSGFCISADKHCDGVNDCADFSDEDPKLCGSISCNEGRVPCRDGSRCVAREERCDGKIDCPDGSDELNCTDFECNEGEFQCRNGDCIEDVLVCDNSPDCLDLSDENEEMCREETGPICLEGQVPCATGTDCINSEQVCDGITNCYDGSDESNCDPKPLPTPKPTPSSIKTMQTTPTTIASSPTTTPKTTTTLPTTTMEPDTNDTDVIEGSGELSCEELYERWNCIQFPGGPPPPLSPDEKIDEELCAFLRTQDLPEMTQRKKRHKTTHEDDVMSDTAEYMGDQPIHMNEDIEDISDLSFVEDLEKDVPQNIELKQEAAAVYGVQKQSSGSTLTSASVFVVSFASFAFIAKVFV